MIDAIRHCPAVLLAAPASGQGKTTVTAALARLLTRRGQRVRVFKCGPDFLDPQWLQLASGAPVHSLDLWINGEADCRARLHAAAGEADVILVEGVMGLFDGQPSAADLSQRFGLPVLAVIDARAMAGTFGALAFGLQHFRDDLPWAGVLANRVGSDAHAQMLQTALKDPATWLGALRRDDVWSLPERHLGLTVASELDDGLARLDAAADALADTPLGRLTPADWQRFAVRFDAPAVQTVPPLLAGRRIAVARDAAFCFIYPANLQALQDMGAAVSFFSPLAGEPLPDCDALWLPGGYPELHAAALHAATRSRASIAAHIDAGRSVWAECGGMMALFESVTLPDGASHPLWALLPGRVTLGMRLAALGPQSLAFGQREGDALRGHTFHYSICDTPLLPVAHTVKHRSMGGASNQGEAVYRHGSVQASYFHAWFASSPTATAALFGVNAP